MTRPLEATTLLRASASPAPRQATLPEPDATAVSETVHTPFSCVCPDAAIVRPFDQAPLCVSAWPAPPSPSIVSTRKPNAIDPSMSAAFIVALAARPPGATLKLASAPVGSKSCAAGSHTCNPADPSA